MGGARKSPCKRAVYNGMGGICACSPCTQHFILKMLRNAAKLRSYPYTYHLDSTANIFLYLPCIYPPIILLFINSSYFFDAFQSKLQTLVLSSNLCIFSKSQYLCTVFSFDKTFTYNEVYNLYMYIVPNFVVYHRREKFGIAFQ